MKSSERPNDLVLFFGLTTGPQAIKQVVNAYHGLGLVKGTIEAYGLPVMMREIRHDQSGLAALVDGRQVKTHSAGSLVLEAIVESGAQPAKLSIYNEVVAASPAALVFGGTKRIANHTWRAIPGIHKPNTAGNALLVGSTVHQSLQHGPSNYEQLGEISRYTAADHIGVLATSGHTEIGRLIGVYDELPFTNVQELDGAPVTPSPGCHDDLLTDPASTIRLLELPDFTT